MWSELTQEKREYSHKYLTNFEITQFFPTLSTEKVVIFTDFITRIACLPASEAASERIFAEMRELFSEKSTNLAPETLRDELIMNYVAKRKNIQ